MNTNNKTKKNRASQKRKGARYEFWFAKKTNLGALTYRSRLDLPAQVNFLGCPLRTSTEAFQSITTPRVTNQAGLSLGLGLQFRAGVVGAASRSPKPSHRRAKKPLQSRDNTLLTSLKQQYQFKRAHLRKFACAGRSTLASTYQACKEITDGTRLKFRETQQQYVPV